MDNPSSIVRRTDLAKTGEAWFSECDLYRYYLRYSFNGSVDMPPENPVVFCMLNPSTANEFKPDPTITRCIGFARAWGHSDLVVVNLFAIRETDSKKLRRYPDRIGGRNDEVIGALPRSWPVVGAWGAHPLAEGRSRAVQYILGRPFQCLRITKSGAPEHPLYLPKTLTLKPYEATRQPG